MSSILDTLTSFETYIDGGSTSALQADMHLFYDNHSEKFRKHFFSPLIKNKPGELSPKNKKVLAKLNDILIKLAIPEDKQPSADLTLYNFLVEISQIGHQQTAYILNIIDERTWFDKIKIVLSGGITLSLLIAGFIYLLAFEELLGVILSLQASLLLVPTLGLIFTCVAALYQFIQNQFDQTTSTYYKTRNNIFLAINTVIGIIGYALILFSASTFFILTGLLILGSVINVVKEIFDIVTSAQEYNESDINLSLQNDIIIHQAVCRNDFNYRKERTDRIISLGASLLLMAIVITWCFLPAGIYFTASIMALKGLVYLGKMIFQKINEIYERERLQTELTNLKSSIKNKFPIANEICNLEINLLKEEEPKEVSSVSDTPSRRASTIRTGRYSIHLTPNPQSELFNQDSSPTRDNKTLKRTSARSNLFGGNGFFESGSPQSPPVERTLDFTEQPTETGLAHQP